MTQTKVDKKIDCSFAEAKFTQRWRSRKSSQWVKKKIFLLQYKVQYAYENLYVNTHE